MRWDDLTQLEKLVWCAVHQAVEKWYFLMRCQAFPFNFFGVNVANGAPPRLCDLETNNIVFVAKHVETPDTDVSTTHHRSPWSIRGCHFGGHAGIFEDLMNGLGVFEKVFASENRRDTQDVFVGSKAKLEGPCDAVGHSVSNPNFSSLMMMAVGVRPFL